MTPVDPDRITKLIEQQQLSYRELGEALDLDPQDLRLGLPAKRLPATALNHLADLVGEPPVEPLGPTDTDQVQVGAHLATAPNGIPRDDLAYALGWTLDRLERALSSLDTALSDSGLRLIVCAGRLRIAGRLEHTSRQSRQRAAQHSIPPLDTDLAHVVYLAASERGFSPRADGPNVERATRLGLIEPTGSRNAVRLTEPVRFSLCLDASGTRPAPLGLPHPFDRRSTTVGVWIIYTSAPCCAWLLVNPRRPSLFDHVRR